MSLQRAIQKLRTHSNDNEDNQTPLSVNGGLVNKPMESVVSHSCQTSVIIMVSCFSSHVTPLKILISVMTMMMMYV